VNLPVNLKILLKGLLSPVNYGEKSVVDNFGPGANVINIYAHKFVAQEIYIYIYIYVCGLSRNWYFFTYETIESHNYGDKSVVDNIDPWLL
jgi:hypothetical protein